MRIQSLQNSGFPLIFFYSMNSLNQQNTIGIVGTAKNTGKTTTLSFLLQQCHHRKISCAVTGIGFDGEEIDTVTSLPKPRLYFQKNTIIATSEACLTADHGSFELLERSGIHTPLGEIIILRIKQPGLTVIAGPNKKNDLIVILDKINRYHDGVIFVDGSLNRLSPLEAAGKLILATGAARSLDFQFLAEEVRRMVSIFHLPLGREIENPPAEITLTTADGMTHHCGYSFTDEADIRRLERLLTPSACSLYFPFPVSLRILESFLRLAEKRIFSSLPILFHHPITLLLSGDLDTLSSLLHSPRFPFFICSSSHIIGITVNPFYPSLENFTYAANQADKKSLMAAVQSVTDVPVINVKETGGTRLLDLCIR